MASLLQSEVCLCVFMLAPSIINYAHVLMFLLVLRGLAIEAYYQLVRWPRAVYVWKGRRQEETGKHAKQVTCPLIHGE